MIYSKVRNVKFVARTAAFAEKVSGETVGGEWCQEHVKKMNLDLLSTV